MDDIKSSPEILAEMERIAKEEPNPGWREFAIGYLRNAPQGVVEDLLHELLRDSNVLVRATAASALAARGNRDGYDVAAGILREAVLPADVSTTEPEHSRQRAVMQAFRLFQSIGTAVDIPLLERFDRTKAQVGTMGNFYSSDALRAIRLIRLRSHATRESKLAYLRDEWEATGADQLRYELEALVQGRELAELFFAAIKRGKGNARALSYARSFLFANGWISHEAEFADADSVRLREKPDMEFMRCALRMDSKTGSISIPPGCLEESTGQGHAP